MLQPTPELRADFLEWLRTGSFRGVRLGMTRSECVERLGEPDDWFHSSKHGKIDEAQIYCWDFLEFSFLASSSSDRNDCRQDELESIYTHDIPYNSEVFNLVGDYNLISPQLVSELLSKNAISFTAFELIRIYSEKEERDAIKYGFLLGNNEPKIAIILENGIIFEFFQHEDNKEIIYLLNVSQSRFVLPRAYTLKEIS